MPASNHRHALGMVIALAAVACGRRPGGDPTRLRVALLPNVTHAIALSARERGSFERALAPVVVEWKAFGSGPQIMEALFAGAVDVAYLGPGPAANGFLRSRGEAVVVLAGAASGGAGLVVRRDAHLRRPEDLHGRRLASPQIGGTPDVSLRTWLGAHQLVTTDRGGDVMVLPLAGADVIRLMQRGQLDGAWIPEPWLSRLELEAGAELLVDERTLWEGGRFPSALLVAARDVLVQRRELMAKLVAAHVAEAAVIAADPAAARAAIGAQITRLQAKPLPPALVERGWARLTVTTDPLPIALGKLAEDARRLGYLPRGDLDRLIDRTLLDRALAAAPQEGGR